MEPVKHTRGWWNMTCWNGLSQFQQDRLVHHGNLEFGYTPMGTCPNGAEVEVTTMTDVAPGPRFYCTPCAIQYLTDKQKESAMKQEEEQHHVEVGPDLTPTDRYCSARCSCGWVGKRMLRRESAEQDGNEHVLAMTR